MIWCPKQLLLPTHLLACWLHQCFLESLLFIVSELSWGLSLAWILWCKYFYQEFSCLFVSVFQRCQWWVKPGFILIELLWHFVRLNRQIWLHQLASPCCADSSSSDRRCQFVLRLVTVSEVLRAQRRFDIPSPAFEVSLSQCVFSVLFSWKGDDSGGEKNTAAGAVIPSVCRPPGLCLWRSLSLSESSQGGAVLGRLDPRHLFCRSLFDVPGPFSLMPSLALGAVCTSEGLDLQSSSLLVGWDFFFACLSFSWLHNVAFVLFSNIYIHIYLFIYIYTFTCFKAVILICVNTLQLTFICHRITTWHDSDRTSSRQDQFFNVVLRHFSCWRRSEKEAGNSWTNTNLQVLFSFRSVRKKNIKTAAFSC